MLVIRVIPKKLIDCYNLMENKIYGLLYVMTEHGMYGLIQAGIIAQTSLEEHLLQFENAPKPITSGVWRHKTNFIIEEHQ